ncbi:nuclear factor 7, brain-like isoform X2 [Carcharodon carcharias]|uniref:nuclear factor 7, brain-like isoform X2 n=1 Tax=Carcharodon carcharias TaxID=13397 RepID=UPI001B7E7AAD|nr:nuclear factor 7, brain-like isoform X2 [Carcharodon carcharias]
MSESWQLFCAQQAPTYITQEQVQVEIASVCDQLTAFTGFLSTEQDKVSAVKKSSEVLLSHVKEQFAEMHSFLCERENALTQELAKDEESVLGLIRENLQKAEDGRLSLEARLTELSAQQSQGDDIEFLKEVSKQR